MNAAHGGSILVVDDTPTNVAVLLEVLGREGFKVLVARDGESALEQAQYAPPNLILLDVMMPGLDGYQTCQRLKAHPARRRARHRRDQPRISPPTWRADAFARISTA